MSVTNIKKFYFWIDLEAKKGNCSGVKLMWVAVNFLTGRRVERLSSKLTLVT